MFRRVLCGLALVGMLGSMAYAAPVITVTDNVVGSPDIFGCTRLSPLPPSDPNSGELVKGGKATLYIFIENIEEAQLAGGGVTTTSRVGALGFHLEQSGGALSFRDASIGYGKCQLGVAVIDDVFNGFPGPYFTDTDISPDGDGDEDFGWSWFGSNRAETPGGPHFVGSVVVDLADVSDPNHDSDPSAWIVNLLANDNQGPGDTTVSQTLILDDGSQPDDVATNVEFRGLVGVPLVPEPATMALLLAGCGGGLIARRRRS